MTNFADEKNIQGNLKNICHFRRNHHSSAGQTQNYVRTDSFFHEEICELPSGILAM